MSEVFFVRHTIPYGKIAPTVVAEETTEEFNCLI